MKDIDLAQWVSEIKGNQEQHQPNSEQNNEESLNKKAHKEDESQNLNMPKKTSCVRPNKYQHLEKIDEV